MYKNIHLTVYLCLQNDLEHNTKLLEEKNKEMTAALSQMENNEKLDIDEAVTPTAPLYKQYVYAHPHTLEVYCTYSYCTDMQFQLFFMLVEIHS